MIHHREWILPYKTRQSMSLCSWLVLFSVVEIVDWTLLCGYPVMTSEAKFIGTTELHMDVE